MCIRDSLHCGPGDLAHHHGFGRKRPSARRCGYSQKELTSAPTSLYQSSHRQLRFGDGTPHPNYCNRTTSGRRKPPLLAPEIWRLQKRHPIQIWIGCLFRYHSTARAVRKTCKPHKPVPIAPLPVSIAFAVLLLAVFCIAAQVRCAAIPLPAGGAYRIRPQPDQCFWR